jgi:hypothetical protein
VHDSVLTLFKFFEDLLLTGQPAAGLCSAQGMYTPSSCATTVFRPYSPRAHSRFDTTADSSFTCTTFRTILRCAALGDAMRISCHEHSWDYQHSTSQVDRCTYRWKVQQCSAASTPTTTAYAACKYIPVEAAHIHPVTMSAPDVLNCHKFLRSWPQGWLRRKLQQECTATLHGGVMQP